MSDRGLFEIYPGKSGAEEYFLPLWMHLYDTAAVMTYLCEHRVPPLVIKATGLDPEGFKKLAVFLAAVHDIGKCTPLFAFNILHALPSIYQELKDHGLHIPDEKALANKGKENFNHSLLGHLLLNGLQCPREVTAIVGAHHGKPTKSEKYETPPEREINDPYIFFYSDQKDIWDRLQQRILDLALERGGFSTTAELPRPSQQAQVLLSGLLIQADWLASNSTYFPLLAPDSTPSETVYPQRVQQALRQIDLPDMWRPFTLQEGLPIDPVCFQERFGFQPNPVQSMAIHLANTAERPGGLLIIEAQMGVGKTEGALAAAEIMAARGKAGGIFFGLPTQATANSLFPRLMGWADRLPEQARHAIRLAHGMAELNEDYRTLPHHDPSAVFEDREDDENGLEIHSWFSGRKQALLADFVVGTVDTALMAALPLKHFMLRHIGLCGKVVIIDECHAYDAYTSRFLLSLLHWLGAYRVPVVLLSATLPVEKKQEMITAYKHPYKNNKKNQEIHLEASGYPLLTWVDDQSIRCEAIEFTDNRKSVQIQTIAEDQLLETIKEHTSDGGCIGVIVNTVRRAQAFAEMLRQALPDKHVLVFHAQFVAEERCRLEEELLRTVGKASTQKQRQNVIVVGTQVLEQSLDIDFDYLITDLCPMDLLLQRIGRLHRHNHQRPPSSEVPTCAVLGVSELEKASLPIYDEWLLRKTADYLPSCVELPTDIPLLVNQVYAIPVDEEQGDKAWEKHSKKEEKKKGNADTNCLEDPCDPQKKSKRNTPITINHMLDTDLLLEEKTAESSVRDGLDSIEVFLLYRYDADHVGPLPWIRDMPLRRDSVPSDEEARAVVRQRIRLPFVFSVDKTADNAIKTMEKENQAELAPWQESPWLKGELILLLDENYECELCHFRLRYDKESGLHYERIGD